MICQSYFVDLIDIWSVFILFFFFFSLNRWTFTLVTIYFGVCNLSKTIVTINFWIWYWNIYRCCPSLVLPCIYVSHKRGKKNTKELNVVQNMLKCVTISFKLFKMLNKRHFYFLNYVFNRILISSPSLNSSKNLCHLT